MSFQRLKVTPKTVSGALKAKTIKLGLKNKAWHQD